MNIRKNGSCERLSLKKAIMRYRIIYTMAIVPILYYIIFDYLPMPGIVIAFSDFNPISGINGLFSGKWVGFKYFEQIFKTYYFSRSITNTLRISLLKIVFGFPAPIIFALLLDQISNLHFKKSIQTISYFPHFLSWVTVSSLLATLLSPTIGLFNQVRELLGLEKINYLLRADSFLATVVISDIWKNVGWGSIIYLAGIAGIDPNLYEAAAIDGASRMKRVWSITLPGISSIIGVMLILRMGSILNAGFDQIFLLMSAPVESVADIIDTYVFREGITGMKYSFATAVSLFKSVIGLILVLSSNAIARKYDAGLW